ncbi:MAG: hypothetical protein GY832_26485 [Chloroflexi bacterium]|nr:hypothetical protein [Chloroflexota bacterium]
MQNLKQNWKKIILIVLVSLIIDVLLHMTIMPVTQPTDVAPSIFVEQGIVPIVAGISLIVTFGAFGVVFALIQGNLPGKRISKGWWYGIAFAVFWLVGFIEVSVLFDTTLLDEINNWLADGIVLLFMSLLMGRFVAHDTNPLEKDVQRNKLGTALIVAALYFVGRYVAYSIVQINKAYNPNPLDVFLWTLAMAVWIGIMYAILRTGSQGRSPITRALYFAGIILGIDWLLFNLFFLVFVNLRVLDVVVRVLIDLPFVALGAFISERLLRRSNS